MSERATKAPKPLWSMNILIWLCLSQRQHPQNLLQCILQSLVHFSSWHGSAPEDSSVSHLADAYHTQHWSHQEHRCKDNSSTAPCSREKDVRTTVTLKSTQRSGWCPESRSQNSPSLGSKLLEGWDSCSTPIFAPTTDAGSKNQSFHRYSKCSV